MIDIFQSCMWTPKSGTIFWKSQRILKSWSAYHPALIIFIIFIVSLYRVIPNCFCKLKGMIVLIQRTNNYIRTLGCIKFWEAKKKNIRIPTWTYNSVGKLKRQYQKLHNHIYCLKKNLQQVIKMLTTRVVAQLTSTKELLVHSLKDSWYNINFVCSKKSSGLRSDERGVQATNSPCSIHRAGHGLFKKLQTMMEICAGTPSCINHMHLWMWSGTAYN